MMCSSCEAVWPDGQQYCACGASVLDAPPVPAPDAAPSAGPRVAAGRNCPNCDTPVPRGATSCLNCDQPVDAGTSAPPAPAAAVALTFPWGPVPLRNGDSLLVGRSYNSPISHELTEFDDVSRTHATVRAAGGALLVIDHKSTNGTWLNGNPVSTSVEVPARPGDRLRFGTRLQVTVDRLDERRR